MLKCVTGQAELEAALNDTATKGGGLSFDGSVDPIQVQGTIEVELYDLGETGPQFFFNGLRLSSLNSDGVTPCIRFRGNAKRLTVSDLNVFGNAYATWGCGNGVEIISQSGAIWLSTFRNIQSSWCRGAGIRVQGDVFENSFYSLDAKDNFGNGLEFSNIGGVVSNCMLYGSNLSRNVRAGLALLDGVQSVDLFGGSFITNGLCGIDAANGIRSALYVNGENTGLTLFSLPWSSYPSLIAGCNLSSNGLVNPAQPGGQPSQYVIVGATDNVTLRDCYVTPYGDNPPAMSVRG